MTFYYTDRLPNQFEDSQNLRLLISIFAAMFEESNAILRTLRDDMTVDDADGVWLDEIGDIVGVARGASQREDATIFTYRDILAADDTAKSFSDISAPAGGHYVGIGGIPDGTLFSDDDYRLLIRAKVLSTYSGDTIPNMYTWIVELFAAIDLVCDPLIYSTGTCDVAIESDIYLTHTQRRLIERYIPRAAGVNVVVLSWPSA